MWKGNRLEDSPRRCIRCCVLCDPVLGKRLHRGSLGAGASIGCRYSDRHAERPGIHRQRRHRGGSLCSPVLDASPPTGKSQAAGQIAYADKKVHPV